MRTSTFGLDSAAAVRTRYGLWFVPRGAIAGVQSGPSFGPGVTPEYVHGEPVFAFEAVLRDMARTVDLPTARWRAKTLEYPVAELGLTGPGWPWLPTLLYGLAGLAFTIHFGLPTPNTARVSTSWWGPR